MLVIAFGHQIIDLFPQVMEKDRVLVHVLEEILARSLPVAVKLDFSLVIVKVQHRVERVIIQPIQGF